MQQTISNDNTPHTSPTSPRHHIIDSNTLSVAQQPRTTLNDLSSSTPKTILKHTTQDLSTDAQSKNVTIQTQPEIIQFDALSNPCYFTTVNPTIDQYDNRVVISIRNGQNDGDSTRF